MGMAARKPARGRVFSLEDLKYEYPEELVPAGHTPTAWLRRLTEEGLKRRFPDGPSEKTVALVDRELALIVVSI